MSRSDVPDDTKLIQSLKEGNKDEAARRILDDLHGIEHAPGTPQQKLSKEQVYLEQLQGDVLRDRELQKLGFSGFSETWTHDGKGHKSAPRLVSDTNHNRVLDSQDLQIDLNNTVLGDQLTGRALKDRTQPVTTSSGELRGMTPKEAPSSGERAPLQGTVEKHEGTTQQGLDATVGADKPRLFQLGAEHTFVKSEIVENLPDGRVIDWTKWHHDMVFAAKREFEQLLANSAELKAQAGAYGGTGSVKLQFDVSKDGQIELKGCDAGSFYGGDVNAKTHFEQIARQAIERLQYKAVLAFPPGSQRSVNSTELQVRLNTGNSAQWQKNDRERTGR